MCGRFTLTSNLDDLQGRFTFPWRWHDISPTLQYRPYSRGTLLLPMMEKDELSTCAGVWFLIGPRTPK